MTAKVVTLSLVLLPCLLEVTNAGLAPNEVIEFQGDWGTWGSMQLCRNNGFAVSFRTQVEHKRRDDTGLNSVCLLCSGGDVVCSKKYYSKLNTGTWHFARRECWNGLDAFQIKYESKQGMLADDTAANDIRFRCRSDYPRGDWRKAGDSYEEGYGYGEWKAVEKCSKDCVICGIQTQVEDRISDKTGLNGVKFQCCCSKSASSLN